MATRYQPGGITVAIGQSHQVSLPPRVFRTRLTCLHFDTDKSFLLPMSIPGIRNIKRYYDQHPGLTVLVSGHTDAVGPADYNLQLSIERAGAVAAYLTNRVDEWMSWYQSPYGSKRWSVREDQEMLHTLTDASGAAYFAGPLTGANDATTAAAVSRFQGDHGLPGDGKLGTDTRRALVTQYMALEGTSLPADAKLVTHGCGLFHPIDATNAADLGNRRVEIFLFDGPPDPAPQARCPSGGCREYPEWVAQAIEDVDLCQPQPNDLVVLVVDNQEPPQPIAGARVTLDVPGTAVQATDTKGTTRFAALAAGPVQVTVEARGQTIVRSATVGSGGTTSSASKSSDSDGGSSKAKAPPGGDADPPPSDDDPVVVVVTDRFIVRLEDPDITTQAGEKAFDWKQDVVHLEVDGQDVAVSQNFGGDFLLDSDGVKLAQVTSVEKRGPHLKPVKWIITGGANTPLKPNNPQSVQLATRLRLSLFDFHPGFISTISPSLTLNTRMLDLFQAARIDDYSLVSVITFGGSVGKIANPPAWATLAPFGVTTESVRIAYLKQLVSEMHSRGQQVTVGYELVEHGEEYSANGTRFRTWLASASAAQVAIHANDIVQFFIKNGIDIDGIGFDFELNGFGQAHAAGLATLLSETAKAIGSARNGFVYYDTGPFQPQDGQGSSVVMTIQKYALASGAPNLIARPMCYNGSITPKAQVRASIACALRPSATSGGGGLHPSQVQYTVDVLRMKVADVTDWCSTLFRPNRVGVVLYNLPGYTPADTHAQEVLLANATKWDAALNPGMPAPGTPGMPLQVPF